MKALAVLKMLFLPRDYDRAEHMDGLRRVKVASTTQRSAARELRRTLRSIDVTAAVEPGEADRPPDREPSR